MCVLCITGLSQEKEGENGEETSRVIMAENITELTTPNHRLKKFKEHQQDKHQKRKIYIQAYHIQIVENQT